MEEKRETCDIPKEKCAANHSGRTVDPNHTQRSGSLGAFQSIERMAVLDADRTSRLTFSMSTSTPYPAFQLPLRDFFFLFLFCSSNCRSAVKLSTRVGPLSRKTHAAIRSIICQTVPAGIHRKLGLPVEGHSRRGRSIWNGHSAVTHATCFARGSPDQPVGMWVVIRW